MAEEHVKDLVESNPNPTLEEEAAALDAEVSTEPTPAIPEKFMRDGKPDYEALAKAYAELEKKQSGKKDDTNEEATAEDEGEERKPTDEEADDKPDNGDEEESPEDAARKATESAGLDFDALSKEYWDTGKLDDSSYAKLESKGIPRHLVDGFIRGQQAILNETRNAVFNEVGGEAQYDGMITWASENLKQSEIDAYDKAVNSGDMNQITLAVKGLKARYEAAEGAEPTVQLGGTAPKASDTFKSWAQVQKAMSDPRYATDPAYVAALEAKLSRSNNLL